MGRRKKLQLEPQFNPETQTITVGELELPNTSLLTALLRAYAEHRDPEHKDFYFWRVAEELWNREDFPEPMFVRHPWAEQIIYEAHRNKYLAVGGAASSAKSHTMAAFAIVNWLSSPHDTLVLITSTTLREARKRIWGSVISLLSVIDGLPGRIRDSIGSVNYVNENGTLFDRAGLSLIAAEKSKTREAVGKFIGIKQTNVIVIADELSEISEAIINAALSNLSKNPNLRIKGLSNPSSRFDAFGSWATPKNGWDSVDIQTADFWDTKWGGKYIRLDGERSPNILAGEVLYPWLPTQEKLEEDRAILGSESRAYMRMVRAVFFDSDEAEGVYSDSELVSSGATRKVDWAGKPVLVAGLDPAFTNGGDRTILYTGKVGYASNGHYVFEFGAHYSLNDDATNKAVPRTYQIVRQVRDLCKKLNIQPSNVMIDSTGAGAPFCDVLAGEWSEAINRVSFGGAASDKRVSANSKLVGTDLYYNRVSELWFVGKELLRTKQIFGVSPDLAQEIVARHYDLVKGGSLKMKLEAKADFKSRFGRSPDLADAAFLALAAARQIHGLMAVEPPAENEDPLKKLKRRSFASLNDALTNTEASLLE
jgi:hypothetical protein